jgi:hypothetical protein
MTSREGGFRGGKWNDRFHQVDRPIETLIRDLWCKRGLSGCVDTRFCGVYWLRRALEALAVRHRDGMSVSRGEG